GGNAPTPGLVGAQGGPRAPPLALRARAGTRRRPESNRRMEVLQTSALPLGYGAARRILADQGLSGKAVDVLSHLEASWRIHPMRFTIRFGAVRCLPTTILARPHSTSTPNSSAAWAASW